MTTRFRRLGRAAYAIVASAVAATIVLPSIVPNLLQHVAAVPQQVQTRSIEMGSADNTATNVSYGVSFIPETAGNIGGIVVDFCQDSPIIGDTACSDPAGFTLGASPTVTSITGFSTSTGSWVTTSSLQCNAAAGQKQVLILTNATAQTPTLVGTTPITFNITGITNPTGAPGAFYARILTFALNTDATGDYTCATANQRPSTFTHDVDYGGIALTTTSTINITAKVMEQITFCVTGGTAPIDDNGTTPGPCTNSAGAGGMVSPNLTIGHGTAKALDFTAVDAAPAFTEVSTNAQHGVSVRMKQSNACANGGLSTNGGTTCAIEGIGATEAVITAGMNNTNPGGAFGMCVHKETGSTATQTAPYDDAINGCPKTGAYLWTSGSKYGMDSTSGTSTLSTYGSQIFADSTGALLEEKNTCVFVATAALITPAGIYSAKESLIATGTF